MNPSKENGLYLDWQWFFPMYKRLHSQIEVDLGAGFGEWTEKRAQNLALETYLVSIEKDPSRAQTILHRMEKNKDSRVKIIQGRAEIFLSLIRTHSIHRLYTLYPEPWPKRRHAKNRLTSSAFLALILTRLAENSEWFFSSDMELFTQQLKTRLQVIHEHYPGALEFRMASSPESPRTHYEKEAKRRRFRTYHLEIKKNPHPQWKAWDFFRWKNFLEVHGNTPWRLTVGQKL